jgi:xanthine/uracil permease
MPVNKETREERTLPGLFTELTREMTSLLRHEVALARAEISEKMHKAGTGLGSLIFGAMVAYAGLLVLLASAVLALSNTIAPWLAALLVGLVVALIGMGLLAKGRSNLKAQNLAPHRTGESLRKDRALAKEHLR